MTPITHSWFCYSLILLPQKVPSPRWKETMNERSLFLFCSLVNHLFSLIIFFFCSLFTFSCLTCISPHFVSITAPPVPSHRSIVHAYYTAFKHKHLSLYSLIYSSFPLQPDLQVSSTIVEHMHNLFTTRIHISMGICGSSSVFLFALLLIHSGFSVWTLFSLLHQCISNCSSLFNCLKNILGKLIRFTLT